jgi:protein-S-isoprenylcysteine O-methyltransferase Ste14
MASLQLPGRIRLLLLALLLACAGTQRPAPAGKPRQEEATVLVWNGVYARTDPPPTVTWMEGADLTCISPAGHHGMAWGGQCMAGLALAGRLLVVWQLGDRISTTPFAHEHEHEALWRDTGDPDAGHSGPAWGPGGDVELAVAALAAAGM